MAKGQQQAAAATDFDDDLEQQTRPDETSAAPKDDDGVPYCAKHHCRMKQTSGGKAGSPVAYHKCSVEGCEETAKRVKSARPVIPAEPLLCHHCSGVSPRPIMERDPKASTLMYTILRCPCCGYKSSPLPRPEFVASHAQSRGKIPVEDLGGR